MSTLSIAYIFYNQQLLVDVEYRLPKIMPTESDLKVRNTNSIIREYQPEHFTDKDLQLIPVRQLITYWSTEQFQQLSQALQLFEWHKNHRFCSRCGNATYQHSIEYAMICKSCRYYQYPRIQPCIITLITRGTDEILLAKNANSQTDSYSLIAGFVEVGETLEQAVQREAFEEVGLRLKNIRYIASQPWPFPSNLMLGFLSEYDSGQIRLQEDEISDANFFKVDNLPSLPLKGSIAYHMITQFLEYRSNH